MENTNTKDQKFVLRINPELKAMAEHEAKKDNRSLNAHIVTVIQRDLKEKGVIK